MSSLWKGHWESDSSMSSVSLGILFDLPWEVVESIKWRVDSKSREMLCMLIGNRLEGCFVFDVG